LKRLHGDGRYRVVTVDLTPLPEAYRPLCLETYAGNIMDRYLLDQIAAHHEIEVVFHLAALLSTRGERDPELAHQVNVEGTLHLLRVAQNQSGRLGRAVRFLFPSSIAVYGLPSLEEKKSAGRIREEHWNLPITMYGCNKLYCEHLGRYFTHHYRQLGRSPTWPASISDRSVSPGSSPRRPRPPAAPATSAGDAARGAQNQPYSSFVGPEARIPFMTMTDATRALISLLDADRERLASTVYNVGAFSASAKQIADRVRKSFPQAKIDYQPTRCDRGSSILGRGRDDSRARKDWDWKPESTSTRAFDEYLVPNITKRYATA